MISTETVFLIFGNRGWILRLGALAYLVNAVFALISGGWHSIVWIGWVLLALGFFALSLNRRSTAYFVGMAATLLGAGVLLYALVRWAAALRALR